MKKLMPIIRPYRVGAWVVALAFLLALAGSLPVAASEWQPHMYDNRVPTRSHVGITLSGLLPDIQPAFGPAYARLNEYISAAVTSLVEEARRVRGRSVTFSYAVYHTPEVVSVLVYGTIVAATTREAVRSINFCPQSGELLTLPCIMGFDVAPLVERMLVNMARNNPEQYFAAPNAPLHGRAFYIEEGTLWLLFDEFQLSTMAGGVFRLPLVLDNIIRPVLTPQQYFVRDDGYNLVMVQLRQLILSLNYDSHWDEYAHVARIWRGDRVMYLTPNLNHYEWVGIQQRSLEAAPELHENHLYVPITFFDQMLNLTTYSLDEYGNFVFLAYRGE